MRIWTIHPSYLDRQGLLALWREGLLAQKVLLGQTRGYKNHPQLIRFKAQRDPVSAIARYLQEVCNEAARRGYAFNRSKIRPASNQPVIQETRGQLLYEWEHLKKKLLKRQGTIPHTRGKTPLPHPSFHIRPGKVQPWEKQPQPLRPKYD